MGIETVILAMSITLAITMFRHSATKAQEVWSKAKWWERGLLVVAFLPIPGPMDELLGLYLVARVLKRCAK